LEKIKTYLVLSDVTNAYGSNDGAPIQSYVYGIEQFTPPGLAKYNPSTLTSSNREISFFVTEEFFQRTLSDISNLFSNSRYISFVVVKFWGGVSQEFTFTDVKLISRAGNNFKFGFERSTFSEKNEKPKTWTGILIPFIRDEKLNRILGDI
jgi:hypothetical protein